MNKEWIIKLSPVTHDNDYYLNEELEAEYKREKQMIENYEESERFY